MIFNVWLVFEQCYGSCQDLTWEVETCLDANGCDVQTCIDEASDAFLCCPPCTKTLAEAADCLTVCVPDTVEESVQGFSSCFDENACDASCSDAFESLSSTSRMLVAANATNNGEKGNKTMIGSCDAIESNFR
jgi:hypothetical protein